MDFYKVALLAADLATLRVLQSVEKWAKLKEYEWVAQSANAKALQKADWMVQLRAEERAELKGSKSADWKGS